ncbi:hypothetical protein Pdca_16040 [Pseudonocardia autotrophica]|nr:hypothetical protein Pdca_16040 [Pseudonocardia autotrophica]
MRRARPLPVPPMTAQVTMLTDGAPPSAEIARLKELAAAHDATANATDVGFILGCVPRKSGRLEPRCGA